MKRKKTLIILGIVLIAMCGGIAIVKGVEKHIDAIQTIDEEILAIDPKTVTSFNCNEDGENLKFVKLEDVWKSDSDENFPVNQENIYNFLDHFSSVHASFIINDVEDYAQYGLDNPECTITITTDENDTTVKLGAFSTMDSKRYISVDEENVYLIDDDLMDYVSMDRDSYMQHDSIPDMDQVTSFTVNGDNDIAIAFDDENQYTYTNAYSYYLLEGDKHLALDKAAATLLINKIKAISLSEYETYTATDSDLSKYGLDNPVLTCKIEGEYTADDITVTNNATVYIGCKDTSADEKEVFARVGDSKIIYKVDSAVYDDLAGASYETLRPSEVISWNDDNVTSIDVNFEGTDYTISIETKDDEKVYKVKDYEVDATDLISDIKSLSLTEVDAKALGTDEELSFTVNQNVSGYEQLNITIYRYDGDTCVVKFGDEVLGYIDRSQMADARESIAKMILNLGKEKEEE